MQSSAFQYLTLPITAPDVTFATGSLFNVPIDIISPAGQHLAYKRYMYPMNWNTNGG
jgi:hypothetical protein